MKLVKQTKPAHDGKPEELVRQRRRQIFDAAAIVFAEKGYHAATMREIAREAGLGKGTLYEYVRSKKELIFLVIEEGHNLIFEQLDALMERDMPPEERWREALRIQMRIVDANLDAAKALMPAFKELEQTDRDLMDRMKIDYISRYSKIFNQCVAAGVFKDIDSNIVCEIACQCAFLWGDSHTLRNFSENSLVKFEKTLFEILHTGIEKK